jgi:mono/diheme cytochrome c family protein
MSLWIHRSGLEVGSENQKYGVNAMPRKYVLIVLAAMVMTAAVGAQAADDGAALYKSKCAGCHGADGSGKPALKAPALKGTTLEASRIAEHITKGEPASKAPHNKGIAGLSDEQAKAIADYIKTLK